jgi:hypothetical protein
MVLGSPVRWATGAGQAAARHLRRGPSPPVAATGAIVLEGEIGSVAHAAFVVENHLEEPISTPVELRAPVDGLALAVDPAVVTLEPGAQAVVRVAARIDEHLGSGLCGALAIRGLPGGELPILVRAVTGAQP